jgi:ATP-dependent helicase/nuclease subunit A
VSEAQRELRALDTRARRLAQTGFERPMVVEAGAGTGKTSILVARILAWSLGPGWERSQAQLAGGSDLDGGSQAVEQSPVAPDRAARQVLGRIVAITFTEAAAAEMARRVGDFLVEVERGQLPVGLLEEGLPADRAERRRRARALLGALDHLTVRTIHAWCHRLLARRPLEAGVHPQFEVDADEERQQRAIREVVEATLRTSYATPDRDDILELAARGFGPAELEAALVALVREGVRPEALARDPLSPERVREVAEGLARALRAFRDTDGGRLSRVGGSARNHRIALDALDAALRRLGEGIIDDRMGLENLVGELRDRWEGKALARFREWARGRFNKGEKEQVEELAPALAERAAEVVSWIGSTLELDLEQLERVRRALTPLLESVSSELRRRGVLGFADLLRGARDLLLRNPAVAAQLRCELDLLLVDEFQDTDPIQCQILRVIALQAPVAERPALFLVGDPKQSIYGWRSADLGAYHGFLSEVEASGGELHQLSVNFRSVPAILDEVERVIEPVMRERRGLQPAFQSLVPCAERAGESGFSGGPAAPIEYWVSWAWDEAEEVPVARTSALDARSIEAGALARDLARLHREQGVAWSSMGVLFRSTTDLETYLGALRAAGVPYAVERDRSYYRRREVIEAAAAVRCVLDPNDHLALLTLLRSSSVGVPDAALVPLWSRGFPRLLSELASPDPERLGALRDCVLQVAGDLPEGIPGIERVAGWEGNLLALLESLALLRESFEVEAGDRFVEKLRSLLLVELSESARFLGSYRAANLDHFFRELAQQLASAGDPQELLRRLRTGVSEGREAQGGRPVGGEAVRVMTIHKAKGLDFDHVYLAQLHKASGGRGGPAIEVEDRDGVLEMRLLGASTPGWARVRARRAAREAAERVRALYVGMTRARKRLVLLGSWAAEPEPAEASRAKTLLDLVASRRELPENLPGLMAAIGKETFGEGAEPSRDVARARWSFPALAGDRAPERETAAQDPPPPFQHQALSAAAEELADRRDRARARMERPFSRTASSLSHDEMLPGEREERASSRFGEAAAEQPSNRLLEAGGRELATAVGTAIHRSLEEWDLEADPAAELAAQRSRLRGLLEELVSHDDLEGAEQRAQEILDRFAASPLLARFHSLSGRVIARELPVLLPARSDAVGFDSGVVDLVYRDESSGEIAVADFKTDRVESRAEIREGTARYRAQGELYVEALRQVLALERPPRFELWFLHAGEVAW